MGPSQSYIYCYNNAWFSWKSLSVFEVKSDMFTDAVQFSNASLCQVKLTIADECLKCNIYLPKLGGNVMDVEVFLFLDFLNLVINVKFTEINVNFFTFTFSN